MFVVFGSWLELLPEKLELLLYSAASLKMDLVMFVVEASRYNV